MWGFNSLIFTNKVIIFYSHGHISADFSLITVPQK